MRTTPAFDGDFVARCREALRLPKAALADAVGITDRVLRTIEASEPVPYLPLIEVAQLADALGVPIARLFQDEASSVEPEPTPAALSVVRALLVARGTPILRQAIIIGLRITPADLDGLLDEARAVLRPAGLALRATHRHVHLIPGDHDDPCAQAILNAATLRSLCAVQIETVMNCLHRSKTAKHLLHSARTGPLTQSLVKAGILIPPDKETGFYEVNEEVRYSLMLET